MEMGGSVGVSWGDLAAKEWVDRSHEEDETGSNPKGKSCSSTGRGSESEPHWPGRPGHTCVVRPSV